MWGLEWDIALRLLYALFFFCSRGELQRESDFMASVDSSWISWGVGVFLLKPLKWTLSNVLGDNKVPAEEVLVALELLKVGAQKGGSGCPLGADRLLHSPLGITRRRT